jgi:hypothetical protein
MKQFSEIPLIPKYYGNIQIHEKVQKMINDRLYALSKSINNSPLSREPIVQTNYYSKLNRILLDGLMSTKFHLDRLDVKNIKYIPICNEYNKNLNSILRTLIIEEQKYICHNGKDIHTILITNIYTELDIEISKGLIDRHTELFNDDLFIKLRKSIDKFRHKGNRGHKEHLAYLDTLYLYWQSRKDLTRVLVYSRI